MSLGQQGTGVGSPFGGSIEHELLNFTLCWLPPALMLVQNLYHLAMNAEAQEEGEQVIILSQVSSCGTLRS